VYTKGIEPESAVYPVGDLEPRILAAFGSLLLDDGMRFSPGLPPLSTTP
jgi:hypothetical protein